MAAVETLQPPNGLEADPNPKLSFDARRNMRLQARPGIEGIQLEDRQSRILEHKRLLIVFPMLALTQFTAYLDQTSISTALPDIGDALTLGSSVSWVATSYLLATTAIQLVTGRLSDIFGRKQSLLISVCALAIGNVVTGFSLSPAMFFVFRTVSGLGGGAITPLVMMIANDITTLKQRGRYNGFIGAAVAMGSGSGPLIGGILTSKISWRWVLWYDVPWLICLGVVLKMTLPDTSTTGRFREKMQMVDWVGLSAGLLALTLLVIPLSRGGSSAAWGSSEVIAMLIVGAFVLVLFLIIEWKFAHLPIIPLHLFASDLSCNILLLQSVLYGFVYWANLFYLPLYLQNVRGFSAIVAGAVVMPLAGSQGIGSIVSGVIISYTGHYGPVMIAAQIIWTGSLIGQVFYSNSTPIWVVCLVGFWQGFATGCCFQPSLIAILAHSRRADRAVLNSLRNSLRTMGGTLGLALSGTILNNTLRSRLQGIVPEDVVVTLTSSAHSLRKLGLTESQQAAVLAAYAHGIHLVFRTYAPLLGVCAVAALFVRDTGLTEKDTSTSLRVPQANAVEE